MEKVETEPSLNGTSYGSKWVFENGSVTASGFYVDVAWGGIMLILVFGAIGNALTLTAVTYATVKKKRNFEGSNWISTNVFIFHLSFVELMYCLFRMADMIYGLFPFFIAEVENTPGVCQLFLLGVQNLGLIDGWSIALIAFTRALPNIK